MQKSTKYKIMLMRIKNVQNAINELHINSKGFQTIDINKILKRFNKSDIDYIFKNKIYLYVIHWI